MLSTNKSINYATHAYNVVLIDDDAVTVDYYEWKMHFNGIRILHFFFVVVVS